MDIEILINQIDDHNECNIIATKKFNPKCVIFIYKEENKDLLDSLIKYYNNYLPNIKVIDYMIKEGDYLALNKVINENKNKKIVVNLSGGSRINSLQLLNICKVNDIQSVYIDIKNKSLYTFDEEVNIVNEEFEELELERLVKASGGEVIVNTSDLSDKEDLIVLTRAIYKNLDLWHEYKQRLYDSNVFLHDRDNPKIIRIKSSLLNKKEFDILYSILSKLKSMGGIEYNKENNDIIKVIFKNEYLKSFIFKSGTWLEVATKNIIEEIKEIDEVKSGVMFLWNDKSKKVKNEVDVIAVRDSIPICISCKDSDKYNEDALNELDVYSKQLGGENAYKILVATKEPIKLAVKDRAKEMGIGLIIFDGDEEKLKNNIRDFIKKS
ncbi:DUF1887 family protein [Clostridium sp. Sa3CUN1]|uniref:DUF1887 family protein n=1 Tax=Clostridium gallinarum TaxID=2762246 RepID=A0ABR8Q6I8_9CLOT|nr:DUF1887 family CARF protein [Clostridium gallinarum]MBD7916043.1 DUF1887 family protein [Clostridium gallinarum]